MNVIDFRSRPPYKSIKASPTFDAAAREAASVRWGMGIDQSTRQASMTLYLQEIARLNIERAVVPLRAIYGHANSDLLTLMKEYPHKFVGIPCIETAGEIDRALSEITAYAVEGPCPGIVLEPGYQRIAADDERLYPIYEFCQAHNLLVFLSFGGLCHENLESLQPIAIDHIAEAFPTLRFVFNHGGWPYVQEMCWLAFKRRNVYLVPDLYVLHAPGGQGYIEAANYLIPEQILFGSAYPVVSTQEAVSYYRQCGLREEALQRVMYQNAANLLQGC